VYTTNPYNMKSADREVRFQCPKCPKQCTTKYNLKAHVNVSHDEVKRHQCYFCSLATFKKSDMIKHMLKHTKEKPYKCQYCFQSYKKKQSLKGHKDGKSCNLKLTYPSLSPCYFCGKYFPNHLRLNVHIKIVHLKEDFFDRKYKCQLCSKRSGSNSELNRHIQSVHTKERPCKCYFCSKSFISFGVLKRHMVIHTREKPLSCYFCQKDFSDLDHLSDHIGRIHTKERPFQCMQCPSLCYSSKKSLRAHVREKHGLQVHQ
jgi:KRAB domain-containing zinc finger protein